MNKLLRQDFVNTALGYIGTPFHLQGRLKGVGIDCWGLIVCSAADNDFTISDEKFYKRPRVEIVDKVVSGSLEEIKRSDLNIGDILRFSIKSTPFHFAIVVSIDPIVFVHAIAADRKVVKHHLEGQWASSLCQCYKIKGIE